MPESFVGSTEPETIPREAKHDLHIFMQQVTVEIASEYDRIFARTKEDPGTAGDQGEENWATILRDWLPPKYQVVTKGRLIGYDGTTSPQIDILILKPSYPRKLQDKKLYLAGGVAAVFECKNTIKAHHIHSSHERSKKFKALYRPRLGTPYKELFSPLIYGLLSHSHSWKSPNSTPTDNLNCTVDEIHERFLTAPSESVDLICVADVATWAYHGSSARWSGYEVRNGLAFPAKNSECELSTSMQCYNSTLYHQTETFTPIGSFITNLIRRLAWEDPELRDLADYFQSSNVAGNGVGYIKTWPLSTYSDGVAAQIRNGRASNGVPWDEWSLMLF